MADYDTNRDQNDRDMSNDDRYRPDETPRVSALSDLGDFQVADGYPDPRGWRVLAADGTEVEAKAVDIAFAEAVLRRLDLNLRTPDAIYLAIAQRLGAELATFDIRMADCARQLGIPVVPV